MATTLESNKTKIAKRVIEVFEFFEEYKSRATVMDIARRYGRPQSSTSELLASLVEIGFLYKDQRSRCYMPTPRLGILGAASQPSYLRNGFLTSAMDAMAERVGHGVALMGVVGTHVQMFRWMPGSTAKGRKLSCGVSETLSDSVGGLLLLSTQRGDQCSGMLRRLNAEAPEDRKFNHGEKLEQVHGFARDRSAIGESGFIAGAKMCAVLLPSEMGERPLALGAIIDQADETWIDQVMQELRSIAAGCDYDLPMAEAAE